MKKFIFQAAVIAVLSLTAGLAYNQFSGSPLPVFEKYDAHKVEIVLGTREAPGQEGQEGQEAKPVPQFQEIDAETLQSLVESEMAVLFDARPPQDFKKGHIPGATSLPISEFDACYDGVAHLLSEGKTIICYCEGINCTDSSSLAVALFRKGHTDIFVYKGGMEEWNSFGYPVDIPQDQNPAGAENMEKQGE